MPSSAGGFNGSRSGAPRQPGAEHLPGHRDRASSLAWPGPARCLTEFFGLQRLRQDGGCRAEKLLSNCAAHPGPASRWWQVPTAARTASHPVPAGCTSHPVPDRIPSTKRHP